MSQSQRKHRKISVMKGRPRPKLGDWTWYNNRNGFISSHSTRPTPYPGIQIKFFSSFLYYDTTNELSQMNVQYSLRSGNCFCFFNSLGWFIQGQLWGRKVKDRREWGSGLSVNQVSKPGCYAVFWIGRVAKVRKATLYYSYLSNSWQIEIKNHSI